MIGTSKKELTRTAKAIRTGIVALVKELNTLFAPYKSECDKLRTVTKKYVTAAAAYAKKSNSKNLAKLNTATEELNAAYVQYRRALETLKNKEGEVLYQYARLIEVAENISARELAKANTEKEKHEALFASKKLKADKNIAAEIPPFLAEMDDELVMVAESDDEAEVETEAEAEAEPAVESVDEAEPVAEESVAEPEAVAEAEPEAPAVTEDAPGARVASVNIAPVTIDVSSIVERAITATMEKFSQGIERRIRAYVDSIVIPQPEVRSAEPVVTEGSSEAYEAIKNTASANTELEEHLLEEEKHIFEKLKTLCASVQELLDGMVATSEAYLNISSKQQQTAELQRQVNDMQRHTMREQQGVQVHQRLINKEQIELNAEQTVITDRQKAAVDKQKQLTEAQTAMEETQRTVIETQAALEEAMKAVMQSQKEIISTQQSIIHGNAKNQEAQRALIERQAEITAAQKEALASQRQLLREQKSVTDRSRELAEGKKAKPSTPVDAEPVSDTAPDVASSDSDSEGDV